jgi:DNA polymerase III delta prime subunit
MQENKDSKIPKNIEIFLDNLKTVNQISAEQLQNFSDLQARPFSKLSVPEFYVKLYEPRSIEKTLKESLQKSIKTLCLIGPAGSGKTTVCMKIKNELEKQDNVKNFITFIDVRKHYDSYLANEDNVNFNQFLRALIYQEYMGRIFSQNLKTDSKNNPYFRLLAFLLDNNEEYQSTDFVYFSDVRNDCISEVKNLKTRRELNDVKIYDWLSNTENSQETKEIIKRVKQQIRIEHLVYAARALMGYNRQYIWFDNIDLLPEEYQSEILEIVESFHRKISPYVATVLTLREEHVYWDYDPIEYGAPPGFKRINIQLSQKNGLEVYPSNDISMIDIETLQEIIRRRLDYTFAYMENEEPSNLPNPMEFAYLRQVSKEVVFSLYYTKGTYLANNSIREFMIIYSDVLRAVLIEWSKVRSNFLSKQRLPYRTFIVTVFYGWIKNAKQQYTFNSYDIVQVSQNWYEERKKSPGCVVHHLILTSIWNLTLDNKAYNEHGTVNKCPTISQVIKRMELLGYSEEQTKRAIHELYWDNNRRSNFLEIRNVKVLKEFSDIDNVNLVYLTYRGKCFVSHSSNTYGYLIECVKQYQMKKHNKSISGFNANSREIEKILLPQLCDIAQMHYETLKDFFKNNEYLKENYLSLYGVPNYPPFNSKFGEQKNGIWRTYQFQSIMYQLSLFLRNGFHPNSFKKLHEEFSLQINKMQQNKFENVDFRSLLNVEERVS